MGSDVPLREKNTAQTPQRDLMLPATSSQVKELAQDYEEMQVMLFGAPPEFRDILDELKHLEAEINAGRG